MRRRIHGFARRIAVLSTAVVLAGCTSFGPNTLSQTRLQYNEAVKTTTEQQLPDPSNGEARKHLAAARTALGSVQARQEAR